MNQQIEGLFRPDLKNARVIQQGQKWGIEAEYQVGEKQVLQNVFDSPTEAQIQIDNTPKA